MRMLEKLRSVFGRKKPVEDLSWLQYLPSWEDSKFVFRYPFPYTKEEEEQWVHIINLRDLDKRSRLLKSLALQIKERKQREMNYGG